MLPLNWQTKTKTKNWPVLLYLINVSSTIVQRNERDVFRRSSAHTGEHQIQVTQIHMVGRVRLQEHRMLFFDFAVVRINKQITRMNPVCFAVYADQNNFGFGQQQKKEQYENHSIIRPANCRSVSPSGRGKRHTHLFETLQGLAVGSI